MGIVTDIINIFSIQSAFATVLRYARLVNGMLIPVMFGMGGRREK